MVERHEEMSLGHKEKFHQDISLGHQENFHRETRRSSPGGWGELEHVKFRPRNFSWLPRNNLLVERHQEMSLGHQEKFHQEISLGHQENSHGETKKSSPGWGGTGACKM